MNFTILVTFTLLHFYILYSFYICTCSWLQMGRNSGPARGLPARGIGENDYTELIPLKDRKEKDEIHD